MLLGRLLVHGVEEYTPDAVALSRGTMHLRHIATVLIPFCAASCGGGPPPAPVHSPLGHAGDEDAGISEEVDAGPDAPIEPPVRQLVEFEPERERTRKALQRTPNGNWPTPEWARAGYWKKNDPAAVPMGTYVRPVTVFVGVEDDEEPGDDPATEDFDDCLDFHTTASGPEVSVTSWHTARDTCLLDGRSVVPIEDGLVVRVSSSEWVIDADTGEEVEGPGCRLKVRVDPDDIVFEEDWPPGCSDWACGLRGRLVGLSFPRIESPETCEEVNARMVSHLVQAEYIGKRPDWANEAPGGEAQALAKYGGAWRLRTKMPVLVDFDPPESDDDSDGWDEHWKDMPVTDKLDICPDEEHQVVGVATVWGVNGHSCGFEGTATTNTAGELLLVDWGPSSLWVDEIEDFAQGPPCHVRVIEKKGRLTISETWPPGCERSYCGERAHLVDVTFKRKRGEVGNCEEEE